MIICPFVFELNVPTELFKLNDSQIEDERAHFYPPFGCNFSIT